MINTNFEFECNVYLKGNDWSSKKTIIHSHNLRKLFFHARKAILWEHPAVSCWILFIFELDRDTNQTSLCIYQITTQSNTNLKTHRGKNRPDTLIDSGIHQKKSRFHFRPSLDFVQLKINLLKEATDSVIIGKYKRMTNYWVSSYCRLPSLSWTSSIRPLNIAWNIVSWLVNVSRLVKNKQFPTFNFTYLLNFGFSTDDRLEIDASPIYSKRKFSLFHRFKIRSVTVLYSRKGNNENVFLKLFCTFLIADWKFHWWKTKKCQIVSECINII